MPTCMWVPTKTKRLPISWGQSYGYWWGILHECWELHSGCLGEQPVFLIATPSLQPPSFCLLEPIWVVPTLGIGANNPNYFQRRFQSLDIFWITPKGRESSSSVLEFSRVLTYVFLSYAWAACHLLVRAVVSHVFAQVHSSRGCVFPFPTMGEACFPRIFLESLTIPNPLFQDLLRKPPSHELSVYSCSCGTELELIFDCGPIKWPGFPVNPWNIFGPQPL